MSTIPNPQSVTIVIPSIREHSWSRFQDEWASQFDTTRIVLVEDNPTKTFDISNNNIVHIAWDTIDSTLGKHSWIIPRRTDCIRSFGYLLSWYLGSDITITLDDDCYPTTDNFVLSHIDALSLGNDSAWVSTGHGTQPRGIPYFNLARTNKTVINHGLWTNVIDFDAVTQLSSTRTSSSFEPLFQTIPVGKYYPMCGMNLSWITDITPMMYFLLMGREFEYDRFGDIWCGIISKKISDHLGFSVKSGNPVIHHDRASNVFVNLVKESKGYALNETLWVLIDSVVLTGNDVRSCAQQIALSFLGNDEYINKLGMAYKIWLSLFDTTPSSNRKLNSVSDALGAIQRLAHSI